MRLFTSRVWYRGDDRFDITRGTGGPAGAPFAPSQKLLSEYVRDRARAIATHDMDLVKAAWSKYRTKYLYEMEQSLKQNSVAWRKLLARERVVLVCYCPSSDFCHRGLLADMLTNFEDVVYGGEIEVAD